LTGKIPTKPEGDRQGHAMQQSYSGQHSSEWAQHREFITTYLNNITLLRNVIKKMNREKER
jgi:hypothetical protein